MADEYWERFIKSGLIKDYLIYKRKSENGNT